MYGIMINEATKPFIREHTKQICEFQGGAVLVLNEKNEPTKVVTHNEWDKTVDPGGNTYLYGGVTAHLKRRFGLTPQFESRVHYGQTGFTSDWVDVLPCQPEIEAVFNKDPYLREIKLTYSEVSSVEYRRNF